MYFSGEELQRINVTFVWHFSKRVMFNQRPFDTQSKLTRRCWSGRSGAGERPITNRWCVGLLHILLPVTETKHAKQNDKLRVSCNDRHLVQIQASHFKPVSGDFISIMQRTMHLCVEHCDCDFLFFFWCACFLCDLVQSYTHLHDGRNGFPTSISSYVFTEETHLASCVNYSYKRI